MRLTPPLVFCLALIANFSGAGDGPERAGPDADASFWLAPKTDLDLSRLAPVAVRLLAAPETSRGFALIKTSELDPSDNFVPSRPDLVPFIAEKDTSYRVEPEGLKVAARPFGDRKYKLRDLPEALTGLTLLQTKMGHKSVVDGRFSVIVSVAKPCYVFLAVDERALGTYKKCGTPSWLQEYAPTGLKIATDEPVMSQAEAAFLVFVRKAPAGRVAFGPPSLDEDGNAMYFAFFAAAR
jgi:hypothetical protein